MGAQMAGLLGVAGGQIPITAKTDTSETVPVLLRETGLSAKLVGPLLYKARDLAEGQA